MKVGIAQIDCHIGDLEANGQTISAMLRRGVDAGCDLVVFPELADTGYDRAAIITCATSWNKGACATLQGLAAGFGVSVICGLAEREGDRIFSAVVAIDRDGAIVARYRKTHLFGTSSVREDEYFTRGNSLTVARLGDHAIGLMVCYDLRFPEVARALTLGGAETLAVVAAWPQGRAYNWEILSAARAIENQVYLIAANRVGTDGPSAFCGSSRLIDPFGTTVACASDADQTLLVGEIHRDQIERCRTGMPVFSERQVGLYGRILGDTTPDE